MFSQMLNVFEANQASFQPKSQALVVQFFEVRPLLVSYDQPDLSLVDLRVHTTAPKTKMREVFNSLSRCGLIAESVDHFRAAPPKMIGQR